jgi:hypothetical protein
MRYAILLAALVAFMSLCIWCRMIMTREFARAERVE